MVGEWKGTKGVGEVPDDWFLVLEAKKKDSGININGKLALNGSGPFSSKGCPCSPHLPLVRAWLDPACPWSLGRPEVWIS